MKPFTIHEIVEITKGKMLFGEENIQVENFVKDTREVTKGSVYVGIKGEHINGNMLYEQAFEKGASLCLLEGVEIPEEILQQYPQANVILVEDTIKALQQLATYKRNLYHIPVIAVTGSVGKTSTKDMIASVVAQQYRVLKTIGNYNNHIGVPLTILGLKEHNALVVEMGMNNLGEISMLTKIAKPTIAVITNVGTAHIGNLGSRENILKAKLEILEGLEKNGTLVINNDNDLLHQWYLENNTYQVKTFGIVHKSDIMATDITKETEKNELIALIEGKKIPITVPVGGEPFIYNALCAITVGNILNIPKEKIQKGIATFELTKKRMEIIRNKQGITIINDCYNANYDSMKAGIEYLSNISAKRKIAVLGDMLELGEYSKQLHEKVGEVISKHPIDMLVAVGEEANYMIQKAKQMGMPVQHMKHYQSLEQAIAFLKEYLTSEDVVLVKASNGMKFNNIIEAIQ